MATTAKQTQSTSSVRGSSPSKASPAKAIVSAPNLIQTSGTGGAEEDIETIAKQISDHAEAIYQTWKARGLAPTEILNCHSMNSNDAFGKTLTPPQRHKDNGASSTVTSPKTPTANELSTMSNQNLKKLVSSFVNEDKARQQTAAAASATVGRKANILTSGTIRDALRKF